MRIDGQRSEKDGNRITPSVKKPCAALQERLRIYAVMMGQQDVTARIDGTAQQPAEQTSQRAQCTEPAAFLAVGKGLNQRNQDHARKEGERRGVKRLSGGKQQRSGHKAYADAQTQRGGTGGEQHGEKERVRGMHRTGKGDENGRGKSQRTGEHRAKRQAFDSQQDGQQRTGQRQSRRTEQTDENRHADSTADAPVKRLEIDAGSDLRIRALCGVEHDRCA